MIGREEDLIRRAVRYDGDTVGVPKQGDLAIVEGRISGKNKVLVHDFIDAASEHLLKGGMVDA